MIDFDPFSEAYYDDPFAVYRTLREEAPAYHHEGLDCYFLSRFEDIWSAVASGDFSHCLLYTSPSPRDQRGSRMPSSA